MTSIVIDQENIQPSQSNEVVLSVEGVSKKFCRSLRRSLFYGIQDIGSELIGTRKASEQLRKQEFWALNDVSFQLYKGESLGLVGKNGSGKTTLLRIIAGLIKPDSGCVKFKGRIAPLIALGAGFNPILTGRENIYANMSILGLSKPEINERFDEVVDFAEIGDAIDAPVQSYSSGMAARLGFATAIYTEPDILLIDEVLAVGDIKFRAKCHRKLSELRQKNTSFILVSHQSQAILNVCDSSIYLANGKLIASGNTASIMNQYEEDLLIRGKEQYPGIMYIPEKPKSESLGLDIISVFFRDEKDNLIQFPISGESTNFCLECQVDKKIDNLSVYLAIREIAGENDLVLHLSSFYDQKNLSVSPGKCEMRVEMPYLGLKPGSYMIKVFIKQGSLQIIDLVDSFRFTVKGEGNSRNLFYQPREWKVVMENN